MTRIIDDYLREVETHLQVGPSQRERILDELRGHLFEKVEDLRNREPGLTAEDAERRAVNDFGGPHELALSFDVGGPTLETKTGRTVVRMGRAVGRGTGRILKFIAVTVGVLLVLSIGVGIWAFYEVRPVIEEILARESTEDLYAFYKHCGGIVCDEAPFTQSFFVPTTARELTAHIYVYQPRDVEPHGTLSIRVLDAEGNEQYNRLLAASDENHETLAWQTLPGTWKVQLDFNGFLGVVDFEVRAKGTQPPSTVWAAA